MSGGGGSSAGGSARVGRLFAGTSGFGYPSWAPLFYTPAEARGRLLRAYAKHLPAVELNNTFYRRPNAELVANWLAATPPDFRFCPKAQRGTSWRAWSAPDPAEPIGWLTGALRAFGEQLGCVLLSAPGTFQRDDAGLRRVLGAWPHDVPLALELPHPSWLRDEVHEILAEHHVSLVASDWDDRDEPDLRRLGTFLYLRLRRSSYSTGDVRRWAERLAPFLADGLDVYAFFRHDQDGSSARHAQALLELGRDTEAQTGDGVR